MKLQKLTMMAGLLAMPMLAFDVQAQQTGVTWNPVSDDLWTTAANWGGTVPVQGYKVFFNVSPVVACVIDSTVGGCQISIGDGGPGSIIIQNGGNLTAGDTSLGNNDNFAWTGLGWDNTGSMTVETGGSVTFNYHLWIGMNAGAVGTLTLDGGTATVEAAFGLGASGGVGVANINGGTLYLNQANIIFGSDSGDKLNIAGGTVSIAGDYTGTVNSDITAGKIVGYDGGGSVNVFYDSGLDRTILTAVPEPATLSLLGLSGLTLWVIRRKK